MARSIVPQLSLASAFSNDSANVTWTFRPSFRLKIFRQLFILPLGIALDTRTRERRRKRIHHHQRQLVRMLALLGSANRQRDGKQHHNS